MRRGRAPVRATAPPATAGLVAAGLLVALLAAPALLPAAATARQTEPVPSAEPSADEDRPGDPAAAPAFAEPQTSEGPMALFITFSRAQLALNGFDRREAEVLGRPLVWWEKGAASGASGAEPLVLVHGVNDQAGTWFRVASRLAARHRVLLVDLPGHGESAPATGPLTMTEVIEGFETWISDHAAAPEDRPPTLIGNSMGAWVALLAARRHPDRVGRVVLVNGGPLRADPRDEIGPLGLLPADREEARRLMAVLRDPASPPTPDPVLDDLVRRVPASRAARMFARLDDLESYLLDEASGGELGRITTPVDLLWGASDRYLGSDYPERLAGALPRARITRLEACGHLPQAECPERFVERLEKLLELPPPSPKGAGPKERSR